jgi:hypothetical protein
MALGDGRGHTPPDGRQHECGERQGAAGLHGRDGCLAAAISAKEPIVNQVQDLGSAQRDGLEGQRPATRAADWGEAERKGKIAATDSPCDSVVNGCGPGWSQREAALAAKETTEHRMDYTETFQISVVTSFASATR